MQLERGERRAVATLLLRRNVEVGMAMLHVLVDALLAV